MAEEPMFTVEERASVRSKILDRAANDSRLSAAAITGSSAIGADDQWSDIDLAFALDEHAELDSTLLDWTEYMYTSHSAIHHLDVPSGAWLYRVFLLPKTLQVDLAFVRAADFRPLGPTFQLIFGSANEARFLPAPAVESLIGFGWLYALHARGSIARGHLWQAEHMIAGLRHCGLAIACVRLGLPAVHGRGTDQLPAEVRATFEPTLVQRIGRSELVMAFEAAVDAFIRQVRAADEGLGARLHETAQVLKHKY